MNRKVIVKFGLGVVVMAVWLVVSGIVLPDMQSLLRAAVSGVLVFGVLTGFDWRLSRLRRKES